MALRPRILTLLAAAVGALFTIAVSVLALIPFSFRSPSTHVALETADALIALLTAYLIFGRFREEGWLYELLLVFALLLWAGSNLFFSALPRAWLAGGTDAFPTWAPIAARLAGAAVMTAAAFVPVSRSVSIERAGRRVLLAVAASLVLIALPVTVFADLLPQAIDPRLSPVSAPRIAGNPLVLGIQFVMLVLFSVSAFGFTRRAERTGDELMRWFGAATTLGAFARLNYFLFPSIFTQYVYTGDILRLGFYVLLLVGSSKEIRNYWRRLEDSLEERRRLDEIKNLLLGTVAHDLRNPVSAIIGLSRTLEHQGEALPQDDRADFEHRITMKAEKLNRMLSDLLDMERIEEGRLHPQRAEVELAELFHRVVADADVERSGPIEIEANGVVANVDGPRVERIVDNLLANAAKHTKSSGSIWLRAFRRPGGTVLAVDDAGEGVPPELRERIFDRFSRGETDTLGSGLGLSLVARFAELHGGKAWVEDRDGGGSSFRVFLPDSNSWAEEESNLRHEG